MSQEKESEKALPFIVDLTVLSEDNLEQLTHDKFVDLLNSGEIPTHMRKELLKELEVSVEDCGQILWDEEMPFNFLETAKDCIKGYKKLIDEAEERYQQYCTKELRKASFRGCRMWKGQTPEILADAGFFHTAGVGLQCYMCKIVTNKQNIGSYPFEEHGRISPKCNHVKMKESTISLVEGVKIYSSGQRTYIPVELPPHQTEHWIEGDNVFAFTCEVDHNNVTVDWFHNDELVVPSNKHLIRNVKKKHTLLITDFDPSDISDYHVVISDNICSQKPQFDEACVSKHPCQENRNNTYSLHRQKYIFKISTAENVFSLVNANTDDEPQQCKKNQRILTEDWKRNDFPRVKTSPSVVEACPWLQHLYEHEYENQHKLSTPKDKADGLSNMSNPNKFDKPKTRCIHCVQTTCEKVCSSAECTMTTVNRQINQSSNRPLDFNTKNKQCKLKPVILTGLRTQDWKGDPYQKESCSSVHLWQKLGYEDAQKPSTTDKDAYPVSNADTFDKHKKTCLHGKQTTCEKVSLPIERSNTTVNGQINQSSINHSNLKTKRITICLLLIKANHSQ